ncbi:uncharacterized protein TNCV_942531 [Trichonephila clavipes]|nr:uncharacterized protein TNCV_942531 [Trichonephila clavipes]
MSRADENMISIYERKILRIIFGGIQENGTGEEDQISSSINRKKDLTALTLSIYNELNGQVTLSEWTKIAPLKNVFNDQPIGTRIKGRPNLRRMDDLEKDLLVLKTKNWRTLAGRRLAWKRLHEKANAHTGLSSH